MRVMLAQMMLSNPDLLLLDEPTNHLDLPSIIWIEQYLKDYRGPVVIVSHDRYFLDTVVNKIRIVQLFLSAVHTWIHVLTCKFHDTMRSTSLVQSSKRKSIRSVIANDVSHNTRFYSSANEMLKLKETMKVFLFLLFFYLSLIQLDL